MDESILSMNTSSDFSDEHRAGIDEDVLNYLSTLSPHQQRMLDDFVSISDYAVPPVAPKFAYGNSVGSNHYFGRPHTLYEPFTQDNEFSSLPPDLVSSNDPNVCEKFSWEAEDSEYIETLNELRDNFELHSANNYTAADHYNLTHTVADVHYHEADDKPVEEHIYATIRKPKKPLENQMIASDRSASDPPREKFPKIMTQSCYGELNNPVDHVWNCYEQDLVRSMENVVEDAATHQIISSLMTDSSIIDGVSSINSSIYEQIPSMTSSIEMQASSRSVISQRKIVKWWDDHHLEHHTEDSTLDLHGTAEEGELKFCLVATRVRAIILLLFLLCDRLESKKRLSNRKYLLRR